MIDVSEMPEDAVLATIRWLEAREKEAIEMMPKSEGGEIGATCRRARIELTTLYDLHQDDYEG
jgi:hypothetical protein